MSIPVKYNKEDRKLIEAFIQAQKEIDSLLFSAIKERNIARAKVRAKKAEEINKELKKIYKERSGTRNYEVYLQGLNDMEKEEFGKIFTKKDTKTGLGTIHTQAVREMVGGMNSSVIATLDGVNRNIHYSLALWGEQIIRQKLAKNLITGESLNEQKKEITNFLTSTKGFGTLRDRSGRTRNPQSYAEMLVRTETARAYNQGKINKAIELGYTKFRIDEEVGCCSICATHNGKIIDIKGKNSIELPPYHPNCRGTIHVVENNK